MYIQRQSYYLSARRTEKLNGPPLSEQGIYNGIGVQIAAPTQSYLDYVSVLRNSMGKPG